MRQRRCVRIVGLLCAVLILELCTGFSSAQQSPIPEHSPASTLQASPSGTPKPQQSETGARKQSNAALYSPAVVTAIGVGAGLFALLFAAVTIHDARKEARENAITVRAQFLIILRQLFTAYDDIHAKFRPDFSGVLAAIHPTLLSTPGSRKPQSG
jgi:hypothetical protein